MRMKDEEEEYGVEKVEVGVEVEVVLSSRVEERARYYCRATEVCDGCWLADGWWSTAVDEVLSWTLIV